MTDWISLTGWATALIVLVLILVLVLPVVWLFARRRWLSRQGGMFDCAMRHHSETPGTGWVLGVARYRGEQLEWFRALSLSWRPGRRFRQGDWDAGPVRELAASERALVYSDDQVMTLAKRGSRVSYDVALDPAALTGLRSWLESAAPGTANYGNTAA